MQTTSKAFVPIKGVTTIGRAGGTSGGSCRLTVPLEIINHLGLKYGDHLTSYVDDAGRIVFEVLKR
jgi:antitoxin component of MazEF toxin-antitoxin module